jgi:geranylgeranyl reductase family protein
VHRRILVSKAALKGHSAVETKLYDTIIVGAGPIGSYLAEKLARLGYKVLVLEKKATAGQDICCTGIVGKECIDLLELYTNNYLIIRQASSAKFLAPSGKALKLRRNDEVAYILDRPALDLALANKAQASGVCYLFGTYVTGIRTGTDCLYVEANCQGPKKLFEAETAVIATGFGSPLTQNLGLGKIRELIYGAQAEVEIGGFDEVEIYLDQSLAPGGFTWLIPTRDGKGLAGLMTHQQPEWHLNKFLSKLKAQGKITSTEVIPGYGVIPLRPLSKTYADRILVVGEAAGQVKPITGGGIYYGLLCAGIAADSLHQAFLAHDFSKRRLSSYQKRWQARLGRELKIGYWMHCLYEKLGNRQIERLHNFIDSNGIPQSIAKLDDLSFDWHSELILKMLKHLAGAIPRRAIKSAPEQKAATS